MTDTSSRRSDRHTTRAHHARIYALRLLYQREITGETVSHIFQTGTYEISQALKAECECPHIESCKPRAYFEKFDEWPTDYVCPEKHIADESERKAACKRSTGCTCRRFYLEHKVCPPQGYPYEDGDTSVDRCRCRFFDSCEYRRFYESFATAPDAYASKLAYGVEEQLQELDRILSDTSDNWALSRMPLIDRTVLRMALWEILYNEDIPTSVAINEAVRLAKEYGGEDSHKFINGILGNVAKGLSVTGDSDD